MSSLFSAPHEEYATVRSDGSDFGGKVEAVLPEIFKTEEGNALFKKASELNGGNPVQVFVLSEKKYPDAMTTIIRPPYMSKRDRERLFGSDTGDKVAVQIAEADLARLAYLAKDGTRVNYTLQRAVYHEMVHAADPEAVDMKRMKVSGFVEPDGTKVNYHYPTENRAVREADAFMAKYYGEKPRGDYKNASLDGTPEIDIHRQPPPLQDPDLDYGR